MTNEFRPMPAINVRYEPGNGTAYNVTVFRDAQGGGGFTWLEGTRIFAAGWFGGNEMRVTAVAGLRLTKEDRRAIAALLSFEACQSVLTETYRGRVRA